MMNLNPDLLSVPSGGSSTSGTGRATATTTPSPCLSLGQKKAVAFSSGFALGGVTVSGAMAAIGVFLKVGFIAAAFSGPIGIAVAVGVAILALVAMAVIWHNTPEADRESLKRFFLGGFVVGAGLAAAVSGVGGMMTAHSIGGLVGSPVSALVVGGVPAGVATKKIRDSLGED